MHVEWLEVHRPEKVLLRVLPHPSVLNSGNRGLWRTFHDLLCADESPFARLSRRLGQPGWRWAYRLRDDIWWIVTMRSGAQPEAAPQNEFLVSLPKAFLDVFLTKPKNHEQWRRCTIEQADPAALALPPEHADLFALKYTRADMFSLAHDYTRQQSPIRELLQVSRELQPGDFAGLFVRLEAVGRRRWKALADYAWDVWNSGGVPQRSEFDLSRLARAAWEVASRVAREVKAIVDDFMLALERAFFAGDRSETSKPPPLALPDPEREALLVNGSLSSATTAKRNLPVYRTSIQALVAAPTPQRRAMLAHSLASAFGDLNGDNRLAPVKINIEFAVRDTGALLPPRWDRHPNIMSCDEVGKLVQLPTAELQEEFKGSLRTNPNVEIELPQEVLSPAGIYMGTAAYRGEKFNVHLPTSDLDMLMTARAFIGSPRMGKDQAAINLVVESRMRHGIGAVVLDVVDERRGHRGMADAIRDHLPPDCS